MTAPAQKEAKLRIADVRQRPSHPPCRVASRYPQCAITEIAKANHSDVTSPGQLAIARLASQLPYGFDGHGFKPEEMSFGQEASVGVDWEVAAEIDTSLRTEGTAIAFPCEPCRLELVNNLEGGSSRRSWRRPCPVQSDS